MAAQSSYNQNSKGGGPTFDALVSQFYAPLYRFAMSLTKSEPDACDLVQDVFVLWANKGHQLLDPSKAKAWLFTSLHRAFLQKQRRVMRFPHQEISETGEELPHIDPSDVNALDIQNVLGLLAKVEPQYRSAVALFYLEDYSYQEIAEILEVPLGTVKSRIARGLAQLKTLLAEVDRFRKSPGRSET